MKIDFEEATPIEFEEVAFAPKQTKGRKSIGQAVSHGFTNAGMYMMKSLVGGARAMARFGDLMDKPFLPESARNSLKNFADTYGTAVEVWEKENPDHQMNLDPSKGFLATMKDVATKPELLVQGLIESAPLMASGIGGTIVGGPVGGWAAMTAGEFGGDYEELRQQGYDPDKAIGLALLSSGAKSAIEQATLSRQFRIGRAAGKWLEKGTFVKQFAKGAVADMAVGAAEEGSQQAVDNVRDMIAGIRPADMETLLEGVGASAALGGPLEMVMGRGFAAGGALASRVNGQQGMTQEQKIDALNSMRQEAIKQVPEERQAEVNEVFAKLIGDVQQGKDIYLEAQDKINAEQEDLGKQSAKNFNEGAKELIAQAEQKETTQDWNKKDSVYEAPPVTEETIEATEHAMREIMAEDAFRENPPQGPSPEEQQTAGPQITQAQIPAQVDDRTAGPEVEPTQQIPPQTDDRTAGPEIAGETIEFEEAEPVAFEEATPEEPSQALAQQEVAEPQGITVEIYEAIEDEGQREVLLAAHSERGARLYAEAPQQYKLRIESLQGRINALREKDVLKGDIRDELYAMANEYLPPAARGQMNAAIKNAKTPKDILRAFDRIAAILDQYNKRQEAAKVREAAKRAASREKQIQKELTQKNVRSEVVDFVREFLPLNEQGRMLTQVRDAKTPRDILKAIDRIADVFENMERKKAIGDIRKLVKKIKDKHFYPAYEERIGRLIGAISLSTPQDATLKDAESLKNYLGESYEDILSGEFTQGDAKTALIPQSRQAILRKLVEQPINKHIDAETLRSIHDALRHLVHQNDTIYKLKIGKKSREQSEINAELAEEATSATHRQPKEPDSKDLGKKSLFQTLGYKFKAFYLGQFNIETLCVRITGKAQSLWDTIFFDNARKGTNEKYGVGFLLDAQLTAILERVGFSRADITASSALLSGKKAERVEITTAAGKTITLTKAHIYDLYMYTKNPDAFKAVLGSSRYKQRKFHKQESVYLEDAITKEQYDIGELDYSDIQQLIDSMSDREIALWDAISNELLDGTQKNLLNQRSVEMDGYEIATVDKWWHITRKIPKKLSGKRNKYMHPTLEGRGQFRPRTGGDQPILLQDAWVKLMHSFENVAGYYGMAQYLRDAKTVLSNPAMQKIIEQQGLQLEYKYLVEQVNNIEDNASDMSPLDIPLQGVMKNYARGVFALNFRLWAQQYLSLLLAAVEFKFHHLTASRGTMTKAIRAEMEQYSPMLRHRLEGYVDREVGDIVNYAMVRRRLTRKSPMADIGTAGMKWFDGFAIADIWRASKAEGKEKGLQGDELMEYTAQRAERVILRTQPTWETFGRSVIGANRNPLVKMLTMFHSQREKLVMMVERSRIIKNAAIGDKKATSAQKTAARAAHYFTWLIILSSSALLALWQGLYDVIINRRERKPRDLAVKTLKNVVSLPYYGEFASAAIDAIDRGSQKKGMWNADVRPAPFHVAALSTELAYNLSLMASHMADDEVFQSGPRKGQPKWKADAKTAADSFAELLSLMAGLPYVAPRSTISGWMQEDEKPKQAFPKYRR